MKNLAIAAFSIVLATLCFGCVTQPKIEATKPWEGHYYSQDDAENAVKNIKLDDGESIWMMSNHTLYRLLKNTGK